MFCSRTTATVVAAGLVAGLVGIVGPSRAAGCGRIYFFSSSKAGTAIESIDKDGGSRREVLGRALRVTDLQPSPDGSRIAFSRYDGRDGDIWIMRRDGTRRRAVTTSNASDFTPVWSPDGRSLAFERTTEIGTAIVVLDLASGEEQEVADGFSPSFAPTGKALAFSARSSDIFDLTLDVFSVSLSDGSITRLTNDPTSHDGAPRWSPAGRWVAFNRYPLDQYNEYEGPYADLWRVSADGSDEQRLTDNQNSYNGVSAATWSPDGRWIAYNTEFDDGGAMHVMRADGRRDRQLTNGAFNPSRYGTWSPGGRFVAFERHGTTTDIWRYDMWTGRTAALTKTATRYEGRPMWSPCAP